MKLSLSALTATFILGSGLSAAIIPQNQALGRTTAQDQERIAKATISKTVGQVGTVDVLSTNSLTFFNGTCTAQNVKVRKEWRNMSDAEKKAFLDAQVCLMSTTTAQTGLTATTDRFSDLQAVHRYFTDVAEGDIIHYVGQFLPWHRMLMHTWQLLLEDECGYTGPLPWWDEKLDADSGNFFQSNMWDNDLGVGGNGSETTGCLTTGPFANRTEHIGPMLENTDYCMKRVWVNEEGLSTGNSTIFDLCYSYNDYEDFWYCVAEYPHHGGHTAVGGLMADIDSSPGDPMFFLHHNYIDRYWWNWQQANASSRLWAMAGNTVNETANVEPATGWVNATLAYELSMYDIIPNVTIESVMNIQGGYLCYEYDY